MSTNNRQDSGIKTTPKTQASPSEREQRLQNRNVRRNDPTSQIRSPPNEDQSTSTNLSLSSTQSFTFPDLDSVIHTPRSPRNTRQYSDRFSRRLDVQIDAQKSYFEAKFSQERDEYSLCLATLEQNFDAKLENAQNSFLAQLDFNAERAVQNKLKDNLIQASTERILEEIAGSPSIHDLANTIITREEIPLQNSLISNIKSRVIPKLTAEFEKILTEQMTESLNKQEFLQESLPDMEKKFVTMSNRSKQTADVMDKIIQKQPHIDNLLSQNKTQLDSLRNDISDAKADIKHIKANLDDIDKKANQSRDKLAEIKLDNSNSEDAIKASTEATSALNKEFIVLLDKINMTSGKLNVMEERALRLKEEVVDTNTNLKNNLSSNDVLAMIEDKMSAYNKNVVQPLQQEMSQEKVISIVEKMSKLNFTNNPITTKSSNPGGDGDDDSSSKGTTNLKKIRIAKTLAIIAIRVATVMGMNHQMMALMQWTTFRHLQQHIIYKILRNL